MDSVQPVVAAVRPIIQDAISSQSVTPIINSAIATPAFAATRSSADAFLHESSWIWGDQKVWWLVGGVAVGFYFGFRVGVVSGRAKRYVASKKFMRAAALDSYEGVKAVAVQSVEVPHIINDSEVLIEVRAASLDPVDLKVSQGFGRGLRDLVNRYNPNVNSTNFPVILGRDGTGVISDIGKEVNNLKVGDKVWFVVPYCVQGSLSNYLVLDKEYVRPLPPGLSFEAGATLPYCGMVVWDMLVSMGGLGPAPETKGKSVFIWGGVRALERLAVQLCTHWGCEVTCVAPLYTHEYLHSLGAKMVINDDLAELAKILSTGKRFDVVVNTAGLLAEDLCLSLARGDGRVVSALIQPPGLKEYGLITGILSGLFNGLWNILCCNLIGGDRDWRTTRLDGAVLDYLGDLVTKGHIDPVGERIFSLDQAELAFRSLAAGGHKGKLVIRMEDPVRTNQELALLR